MERMWSTSRRPGAARAFVSPIDLALRSAGQDLEKPAMDITGGRRRLVVDTGVESSVEDDDPNVIVM